MIQNMKDKVKIKKGDKVQIHYRSRLHDKNEFFESTYEREPFEIILGESKIIKGFEKTLIGMKVGESTTVLYSPEDAYGHYNPALIAVLKKSEFPRNSIPAVGWMIKIGHITAIVKSIDDTTITLDGNHPLAGKEVYFEITVMKIH